MQITKATKVAPARLFPATLSCPTNLTQISHDCNQMQRLLKLIPSQ